MSTNRYEETWTPVFAPLVFFLPCFYSYGIRIDDESLVFGYGFRKPGGITAKRVELTELDSTRLVTGSATWEQNLSNFLGWGIRYDLFHVVGKTDDPHQCPSEGWAYNASSGPYVDIVLTNGTAYRLASRNPELVKASLLEALSSKTD